MNTLSRAPESKRWGLATIAMVLAALLFSIVLVVSSGMGFKWFFIAFVTLNAVCVAIVFPSFRLFVVLLLTACIPIAIQYNLFDHGNKYVIMEHFGGAQGNLVINLVDFPIIVLFFVWLVDLASEKVTLPKWQSFDTLVVLFILASALSIFNTDEYALLLFEELRYLKYFLVLWMLRTYFQDEQTVVYALYVVGLVAGFQFLLALLQYFLFFTLPFPVGGVSGSQYDVISNTLILRVSGTVGHCNTFAAYLLFPITISFVFLLSRFPIFIRVIAAGVFVASCIALVLTFSRNGWMNTFFAVSLLFMMGAHVKRISGGAIFGMFVLLMLVLVGLLLSGVMEVVLIRIFEDDGKAYDSRWDLIKVALEMLYHNPVIGIGLNSFEENMSSFDTTGVTNIIQQPVHNILFLIAAETGLLGLILFLLMCRSIAGYVFKVMKMKGEVAFLVGSFSGVVLFVLLISNMFDVTLRKEPIIGMCVLIIAMLMALANRDETSQSSQALNKTG